MMVVMMRGRRRKARPHSHRLFMNGSSFSRRPVPSLPFTVGRDSERHFRHFPRQYLNTFLLAVFEATAVSLRGEEMQRYRGYSCNINLNHAMEVFHRYFQGDRHKKIHFTHILLCNFTSLQNVVQIKELTQSPLFYHYFINFSFSAFMASSDCRCEGITRFKNVSSPSVESWRIVRQN